MTSQYKIKGAGANEIAQNIEVAILEGDLRPGAQLPAVRTLAANLKLSPTTVASAYQRLRLRGLVTTGRRRGTLVSPQMPLGNRPTATIPGGARNLADGNPDPALLPALAPLLARLDIRPRLYGERANRPELLNIAADCFAADGVPRAPVAIVGGALDGIERVLQANLRPGDRVGLEDPGYYVVFDLLKALGLLAIPIEIDEFGPTLEGFEQALKSGLDALVITPRAQNPTGAALDRRRATELIRLLRRYPAPLLVEDDHAGPMAGVSACTLCTSDRTRWAVVRSVTKFLGPDLRLAFLTGDRITIGRVERRQMLGTGWVSHLLQQLVAALWSDTGTMRLVQEAARAYTQRRSALINSLARRGVAAYGRSGLNIWIPVSEEFAVVQSMLDAGWAIAGGERYRLNSPPAVRVTTARMLVAETDRFAADLARSLAPGRRSLSA